jgi:hypothetical protein
MNDFIQAAHHITNDGVWFLLGAVLLMTAVGAIGGLLHRCYTNRMQDWKDSQLRHNYHTIQLTKQKEIENYEIN